MAAILGLDISKDTIDACLLSDDSELAKKVSNNAKGFAQLKKWLENRRLKNVHVCMEATGSYFEAVAEYFADRGFMISVVNPAQIKAYSQSLLLRAKTDAVDAMAIAKFCAVQQPPAWVPPTPKERELRGLVRLCANLKDTRASYEVQRQRPNIVETVERSIEEVLAGLDDQIEKIEEEIANLIDDDPDLRNRRNLLTSIDGIANITAAMILAEAPRLEEFRDAKKLLLRSQDSHLKPELREHLFEAAVRSAKRGMHGCAKRFGGQRSVPCVTTTAFAPSLNAFVPPANPTRKSSSQRCGSYWSWPTASSKAGNLTRQP